MDTFLLRLGREIAKIRRSKALTQENLAAIAGLDRSYLSEIERGLVNPSLETLKRIADALGVSLCSLLCVETEEEG